MKFTVELVFDSKSRETYSPTTEDIIAKMLKRAIEELYSLNEDQPCVHVWPQERYSDE